MENGRGVVRVKDCSHIELRMEKGVLLELKHCSHVGLGMDKGPLLELSTVHTLDGGWIKAVVRVKD